MAKSLDVTEFINEQKISWFQLRVVLICMAIQYLDGFNWLVIAYTGPSIASEWHITRASLGAVFSAGVFGVALGTLALGPLADIFGRRKVTITAVGFFGALSLAMAFATARWQLIPLRFIGGLGLGAVIPSCIVLVTEYAPRRRRATMVMLAACGFAIGSATSGLIAVRIIPWLGWRAVFVVAGGLPLLLVLVLLFWLPESIRFLVVKQDKIPTLIRILNKINSSLKIPSDATFELADERIKVRGVAHLFQGGNGKITPVLWSMFFLGLLVMNFLNSWLPSVGHIAGFALPQALRVASLYQFGGMAGIVGLGILADRFGFAKMLGCALLCGLVGVALMPFALSSAALAGTVFAFAGFFTIGNAQLLNAFVATIYPTSIRSTGTSWALGVGRFGSTSGPLLGGILLGIPLALPTVFFTIGVLPLVLAFGALLLVTHLRKGQALQAAGAAG